MMVEAENWRGVILRYVALSLPLHAAWEFAQLPLYTIWTTGTPGQFWFAVFHCTLGDLAIAASTLMLSLALCRRAFGNDPRLRSILMLTIALGVGYTIFSEWFNVHVRATWSYAPAMPLLPPFGTGLSPILQWLIVPSLAMRIAADGRRPRSRPP